MDSGPRVIDDLLRPRLRRPLRLANVALRPLAKPLRPDELLAAAQKATGLTDFGDPWFRGPLSVLCDSLEREARLHNIGRVSSRQEILGHLKTRLRLEDLLRRHPEIRDERIERPIIIVGLPRSGTSHLHNLLSLDPDLRFLPYWEGIDPVPPGGVRPDPGKPDPRIKRTERALALVNYAIPYMRAMHETEAHLPHEEISLLGVSLSTVLFEASQFVPSYGEWYRAHDQAPAYRYLKVLLQMLQWARGGRRWVLKSPQHLEQIGPLLEVFPDATIVQTHRDPVPVTASMCTMLAYSSRMKSVTTDLKAFARYWAERAQTLLRTSVDDRHRIPDGRVVDVRFHEYMADQVATVKRVYEAAGQPLPEDVVTRIERYIHDNPRDKHGTIRYDLGVFGIDPDERREALRFYQERFEVPDDPRARRP